MTHWTCARCAKPDAVRMRNSALCQGCWRALAADGLRWCPRCRTPQRGVFGYCAPCRAQVDHARRDNPDYRERKRARDRAAAARQRESRMDERCRHEAKPSATPASETAPTPILTRADPQEPAQRVEGAILGREGGYTYTVNGAWVSRAGMGRTIAEWERLRNWGPSLPAYRRCHTPLPVVLPMGAEPVTAWGKRRVEEVEG